MNIPPANAPIWRDIITGKVKYNFEYLAAKLLLGTLSRTLDQDPSPANLDKCCETLRDLFVCNTDQPLVQNDLKTIMVKETNRGS